VSTNVYIFSEKLSPRIDNRQEKGKKRNVGWVLTFLVLSRTDEKQRKKKKS